MGKIQSTFADPNDPSYILAGMVTQNMQQDLAMKLPTMTRGAGFGAQVDMFKSVESIKPVTDQQYQNQQDAKTAMAQQLGDQMQYFKQMLLMQQQYELQRKRAQDDYHQQRTWQEQAYHLQRMRAEQDFNRQQKFALQDYHRSVRRAEFEFQLQRKRTEADFNHQVEVQAKQMATSVYDVYQRVQEQRTSSASWLIANATDQLKRMQEQEANLKKLRDQGLSNQAIQTLKLTDPAQAQEAARLVAEMTPQLVARFNKVAGTERVKAAKALVTDPSSLQWEEDRRNLRIQEQRGQTDHERQMKINHDDFFRNIERSRDEFNRMMARQATDENTALTHMQTQYNTSMARSAEDMALAGKEMSGGLMKILNQSINSLTGNARQQAIEVKRHLNDLRADTNPIAVAHMQELSKIYGFQYKVPAGVLHQHSSAAATQTNPTQNPGSHSGTQPDAPGAPPQAMGGVLPGWSPGRDDRMVPLSGGEAIMRPEWARAVGKKHIDEMNHDARHGGFWLGGTMPLPNATSVKQHTHGYSFATWAGDLNYPGRTDYGKPIVAWRSGIAKPFDYHADTSYGRGQVIDSGKQSALYAHMSKVITALAGKQVQAGQTIGYVGDYGNTGNPPTSHLHFEIRGGQINLGDTAATGTGATTGGVKFSDVFKKTYPKPERTAWRFTGIHPLNPGDISKVMNRLGHRVLKKLDRKYGGHTAEGTPIGDTGADAADAPDNVHGNVAIGKRMAADYGWKGNEWDALYQLWQHESGWRAVADNPTSEAYGIPQSNPGSKMATAGRDWATNPATQIKWGLKYIKDRYKTPSSAWSFWQAQSPDHWYGDGAVFNGPQTIGVGERGPEAVIPLNDRGGEFLTKAMMGADARGIGLGSSPVTRGSLNVYNTKVDRSTNFTGPITVQANNPNELLNQLQARQRVMALSRPSLTGSAA
jgi:murein DD-endopeptidase MepM/ murein hydrolase activator NlpD